MSWRTGFRFCHGLLLLCALLLMLLFGFDFRPFPPPFLSDAHTPELSRPEH